MMEPNGRINVSPATVGGTPVFPLDREIPRANLVAIPRANLVATAGGTADASAASTTCTKPSAASNTNNTDPSKTTNTNPSKQVAWHPKDIKDLYDGVFDLPETKSADADDICDALAGVDGSDPKLAEEVAWTDLPLDFLLDRRECTKDQLMDRLLCAGPKIFCNTKPVEVTDCHGYTDTTYPQLKMEPGRSMQDEFDSRIMRFRSNIMNAVHVEINREWKSLMDQCVPELKCKSFDHFLVLLHTRLYDNSMRRIVHIVCHTMWSREAFIRIEKAVMKKLRIRYVQCNVDGKRPKTFRRAGFIAKIGTRLKQTAFIDKVRDIGRKDKKEVLYERLLKDKKPQEGVVSVIEANTNDHGFNGYIGLFAGHPDLVADRLKPSNAADAKPSKTPPTMLDLKRLDLEDFIQHRLMSENKPASIQAVMEEWKAIKSKEVVVSLGSAGSEASPLTEVRNMAVATGKRVAVVSDAVSCLMLCRFFVKAGLNNHSSARAGGGLNRGCCYRCCCSRCSHSSCDEPNTRSRCSCEPNTPSRCSCDCSHNTRSHNTRSRCSCDSCWRGFVDPRHTNRQESGRWQDCGHFEEGRGDVPKEQDQQFPEEPTQAPTELLQEATRRTHTIHSVALQEIHPIQAKSPLVRIGVVRGGFSLGQHVESTE